MNKPDAMRLLWGARVSNPWSAEFFGGHRAASLLIGHRDLRGNAPGMRREEFPAPRHEMPCSPETVLHATD